MEIERCTRDTASDWAVLRAALWPEVSREDHARDIDRMLGAPEKYVALLAVDGAVAVGFAEASLRFDYVNGCETSPVAFLEGIYVLPEHRRKGVARSLCAEIEGWGRAKACTEMASDALLDNNASHHMHAALGFEETERVVYFRKTLTQD